MWEPRGHADMYGCFVTPAVTPGADLGVLFLHNEGYSSMCGHGIIGLATVAVETGMVPTTGPVTVLRIDTPAGLVTAFAEVEDGRVRRVRFHNVPSFVLALDQEIDVPGLGRVRYDIAYGAAFYAYVDATPFGFRCTPDETSRLVEAGMAIKRAVVASLETPHPFEPDLSFLYGTIFVAPPIGEGAHSRNVCIFAEGEVDRSPTGTGVSGRMALHSARNEVAENDQIEIESIIGTRFTGKVVGRTKFGPYNAVIPEVGGSAWITGRHEFYVNPDDPLKDGFLLR